jgi:hypothetical protein
MKRLLGRAGLILFVACDPHSSPQQAKQTGHAAQAITAAFKSPGESCEVEGVSACKTIGSHAGVCFHYGPGRDRNGSDPNFVCSTTCDTTDDCYQDFECVQLAPGQGNSVCAPHPGLVPHVSLPRDAGALPSTPPVPPPPLVHVDWPPIDGGVGDGGTP